MLDTIGQPRGNEGAINVLRKSYVSSEMDKAGARMTDEERQALAFHMRHSVNTSYKLNKCGVLWANRYKIGSLTTPYFTPDFRPDFSTKTP